jgi:hypothetical protein
LGLKINISRLDVGEGDQDHRIVEAPAWHDLICNLCDSGHLQRRKNAAALTHSEGRTTMKRFLILVALGFFLAAHGAVGFMSIYPEPALPVEIPQAPRP